MHGPGILGMRKPRVIPRVRCKRCGCLLTNHCKAIPNYCAVCSCPGWIDRPQDAETKSA